MHCAGTLTPIVPNPDDAVMSEDVSCCLGAHMEGQGARPILAGGTGRVLACAGCVCEGEGGGGKGPGGGRGGQCTGSLQGSGLAAAPDSAPLFMGGAIAMEKRNKKSASMCVSRHRQHAVCC